MFLLTFFPWANNGFVDRSDYGVLLLIGPAWLVIDAEQKSFSS